MVKTTPKKPTAKKAAKVQTLTSSSVTPGEESRWNWLVILAITVGLGAAGWFIWQNFTGEGLHWPTSKTIVNDELLKP